VTLPIGLLTAMFGVWLTGGDRSVWTQIGPAGLSADPASRSLGEKLRAGRVKKIVGWAKRSVPTKHPRSPLMVGTA
jgi:hypothetical protein